jgi:hypothetical protein
MPFIPDQRIAFTICVSTFGPCHVRCCSRCPPRLSIHPHNFFLFKRIFEIYVSEADGRGVSKSVFHSTYYTSLKSNTCVFPDPAITAHSIIRIFSP